MSAAAAPRRGLLRAGLATLVAAAILVGLGAWQLERLAWKEALIATIAERMAAPPAPLPAPSEWSKLDLDQWRYRRVQAIGTFDPTREVRIYTLLTDQKGPYAGPGYWIIEPLRLRDGGTVLVNRGFVPESRADPASRPDGHTVGETTVVGLLREPEDRNMFTPADAPEKRLFFTRDPQAIAAALGLSDAAPFTIDADATPNPGGLPQGGETRLAFPNRHLEYALTWFGLAGALCAVFAAFAWQTLRPGRRR
ncbi:SURF1 family protein [Hansschlegelia beijingensis]|uniref:SURF1-like protein n=1 Tax=Hansschlegelia beijingensis TaxID=1133344 RepID=A0A7W6D740_9HYPH|nr:SURF1 family protein [Hansschlegelia beijingensis]MBB3973424.1 surfeit locus 1 family protein [Hansschlegelia beijingensis]